MDPLNPEVDAMNSHAKIKEIVDGITDITDPAGMEKLMQYYDEITKDDDEFMRLLDEKLSSESVYWEQPWYQQHGKISRPPKFEVVDQSNMYLTNTICQEERERIEKNWRKLIKVVDQSNMYLTNTICQEERERIEKNWRKLIKKYDIPDKLVSLCRWKNLTGKKNSSKERARRFVVAYLARGLKRNLYQVLRHIIAYYGTIPKGNRYKEVENKIVEMCFYHDPNRSCRMASLLLGREPRQIYAKLHVLNGKEKTPKKLFKWKLPLASKFLRKLLKHSGLSLEELKNGKLEKPLWLRVAKSMHHSYISLQQFWYGYLHVQLFVDCDIKLYRLRKKILKIVRAKNYKVWGDIRWKEILEELPDGLTINFVYHLVGKILRNYPNYRFAPLEDVLTYGFKRIKELKLKNKRLNRLTFRDGKLEKIVNV